MGRNLTAEQLYDIYRNAAGNQGLTIEETYSDLDPAFEMAWRQVSYVVEERTAVLFASRDAEIARLHDEIARLRTDAEGARAGASSESTVWGAASGSLARPFIAAYEAEMLSRIDKLTTAIGDVRADDIRKLEHATAYIEVCEDRIRRLKHAARRRKAAARKKPARSVKRARRAR